jgi:hypothetical protein
MGYIAQTLAQTCGNMFGAVVTFKSVIGGLYLDKAEGGSIGKTVIIDFGGGHMKEAYSPVICELQNNVDTVFSDFDEFRHRDSPLLILSF